jgi:hypothetical protein
VYYIAAREEPIVIIEFLFSLPLWALALVLNAWLITFSLASLWAVRRWVVPRLRIGGDDALFYGAAVMQSGMVLYGLVAALTAVSVWERHGQVTDIVSNEATAIASLWRDLGGYPQPEREAMRDVLRDYTDQIINGAWPAQQRGQVPREGVEWMNQLQARLFAFEPASESQRALHSETLRAYNHMIQARNSRLDAVASGLPGVIWFVLLPGAMGCLLLSLFVRVEDGRFQALLVIGLSGFVAMVLFVILTLDRPFRGPMAISAESYQLVYDLLMKR